MTRKASMLIVLSAIAAYFCLGGGCLSESESGSTDPADLLGSWDTGYGTLMVFSTANSGYLSTEMSCSISGNGTVLTIGYNDYIRVSGSGTTLVGTWETASGILRTIFDNDGYVTEEVVNEEQYLYRWTLDGSILKIMSPFDYTTSGSELVLTGNTSLTYELNGDTLNFYGDTFTRTSGTTGQLEGEYEWLYSGYSRSEAVITSDRISISEYDYFDGSWELWSKEEGNYTLNGPWIIWRMELEFRFSIKGSKLTLKDWEGYPMTYTRVD